MSEVELTKCVPLECCVGNKYYTYMKMLERGESIDPVEGVPYDGSWLIIDGSHRCKAAVDSGLVEIELVPPDHRSSNTEHPENIVEWRREQGYEGFECLPIVPNDQYMERLNCDRKEMSTWLMLREIKRRSPHLLEDLDD